MTSFVDYDVTPTFEFDIEELIDTVFVAVMDYEKCPYEAQINVLITDSEQIREINKDHRNIDSPTDVLSFPTIEYDEPGNFSVVEEDETMFFEPDSGELILGDVIINVDRVLSQAEDYGHSIKREFAFLLAHSLFHLCGYDHMESDEALIMEQKQEAVLQNLGITRN